MQVDIAIVGGGLVGGALAAALAGSGLRAALVEPKAPMALPTSGFDLRIYALNPRCLAFLAHCGVLARVVPERIAPVRDMRIFGDDGKSELTFSAYRSGVLELAAIVEEANLQQALRQVLDEQTGLEQLLGVECAHAEWGEKNNVLTLSDGRTLEARLVVAADGAGSKLRAAAGIEARVHEYGQKGVVANFQVERAHEDIARQWFRGDGILALLPLPGKNVSMVWSTDDQHAGSLLALDSESLTRQVELATGGALGSMRPAGPVAAFALRRMRASRLIASRLALAGDAAHNVHPLAGQGLNLGLGDAESLAGVLRERGMENDCGADALLRRYERSRKEDILAMEWVTDGLQKLFGQSMPGIAWLRNTGLNIADRLPPLKRILVKRALG